MQSEFVVHLRQLCFCLLAVRELSEQVFLNLGKVIEKLVQRVEALSELADILIYLALEVLVLLLRLFLQFYCLYLELTDR